MIPIKNLYYMLTYVFQNLSEGGYDDLKTEEFGNAGELFAAILIKGIGIQLRKGLEHEYENQIDMTSALRGKIDVSASIKTMGITKKQLVCSYDEYTVNSYKNRIIKTTVMLLLRSGISHSRRRELLNMMLYFTGVDTIDPVTIQWNFQFNQSNQSYRMMIGICFLVIKGLLHTEENGSTRLMTFVEERQMCRIYEKFILEYYRREHPELSVSSSRIDWQLDDSQSNLLPVMQTDVMLRKGNRFLIIDAKYYENTLQTNYGKRTLHSNNLYQIFAYVKNKEAELSGTSHAVAGMLLYAKTDEELVPDNQYSMSGNAIYVKTLDLDKAFSDVAAQLDAIADSLFNHSETNTVPAIPFS